MTDKQEKEKTIVFVVYPGLTPLDLVGPLQVLVGLQPEYQVTIAGERIEPLVTDSVLKLVPDRTLDEVADPFAVFVPGGGLPTLQAMGNAAIRDYLSAAAETAEVVGSVCTGALLLAAAGLLKGRQATTHWAYYKLLENLGVQYVQKRWVEDDKFITSAGVSAGIDMALHLMSRLAGEARAKFQQLAIEYDPQPPFGPIDWSHVDRDVLPPHLTPSLPELRQALSHRPDLVAAVENWIPEPSEA